MQLNKLFTILKSDIMKKSLFFLLILAVGMTSCEDDPTNVTMPEKEEADVHNLLQLPMEQRVPAYRNMDQLFYTRTIAKGKTALALPRKERSFDAFRYTIGDQSSFTLDDFMERNVITGLLVIKDGCIQLEQYRMGNNEKTRWTSFSVAKSFTSTLIGMAIKDGLIDINQPVKAYLPNFEGSAYGEVLVKHLLQMSSGIDWIEDYSEEDSSFKTLFNNFADGTSSQMHQQLMGLPAAYPTGVRFNYSTGDSTILGMILRAVLGKETLSAYLSRKVWSRMGMESDAYWVLDSKDGTEWGGGCISMTLRDEARFGLFILNNGQINGESLLPSDWNSMAYQPDPDCPHLAYGYLYSEQNCPNNPFAYPMGYGYCWWCLPPIWIDWEGLDDEEYWGERAIANPKTDLKLITNTFTAAGVFGQYLHINQKDNQVTVVWCARDVAEHDPMDFETMCFIEAVTDFLNE